MLDNFATLTESSVESLRCCTVLDVISESSDNDQSIIDYYGMEMVFSPPVAWELRPSTQLHNESSIEKKLGDRYEVYDVI